MYTTALVRQLWQGTLVFSFNLWITTHSFYFQLMRMSFSQKIIVGIVNWFYVKLTWVYNSKEQQGQKKLGTIEKIACWISQKKFIIKKLCNNHHNSCHSPCSWWANVISILKFFKLTCHIHVCIKSRQMLIITKSQQSVQKLSMKNTVLPTLSKFS
jgi:hypothetical protein